MEDKQYTFRTDPSYAAALKEMGVDVVTLANNHILDYGREALSDTFTTLDGQGILYAGAGDSVERAQEVQVIEVNGKKYGFLAASRVQMCIRDSPKEFSDIPFRFCSYPFFQPGAGFHFL